jgi:hypothetical protein
VTAQEVRFHEDIVVHHDNILPARDRYSRVTRGGYAGLLFVNEPQRRGETLSTNRLVRVVSGAVVGHYYFPRLGKLLLREIQQSLGQRGRPVVCWNNYADRHIAYARDAAACVNRLLTRAVLLIARSYTSLSADTTASGPNIFFAYSDILARSKPSRFDVTR